MLINKRGKTVLPVSHIFWLINMALVLRDKTNLSFRSDSFIVLGKTLFYSSPLHVHLALYCLLKASQRHTLLFSSSFWFASLQAVFKNWSPVPSATALKHQHCFPTTIYCPLALSKRKLYCLFSKGIAAFLSFWILSFHKDDPGQIMFTSSGKAKKLQKDIFHLLNIFKVFFTLKWKYYILWINLVRCLLKSLSETTHCRRKSPWWYY